MPLYNTVSASGVGFRSFLAFWMGGAGLPPLQTSATDQGRGYEAITAAATGSNPDSGRGTDTPSAAASGSSSQTGTGDPRGTVAATVPLVESGLGRDLLRTIVGSTTNFEYWRGVETPAATGYAGQGDAGAGTDTATAESSGVVTEEQHLVFESGRGFDSATATGLTTVVDTGRGTDRTATSGSATTGETGSGRDATPQVQAQAGITDSARGFESAAASGQSTRLDIGRGTESLSAAASGTTRDAGSGREIPSAAASGSTTDQSRGFETPLASGTVTGLRDQGTGNDTPAASGYTVGQETGTGLDRPLVARITVTELAVGTELVSGRVQFTITEVGVSTETPRASGTTTAFGEQAQGREGPLFARVTGYEYGFGTLFGSGTATAVIPDNQPITKRRFPGNNRFQCEDPQRPFPKATRQRPWGDLTPKSPFAKLPRRGC